MLLAETPLHHGDRFPRERFGLGIASLDLQQSGEVVEVRGQVGMILAKEHPQASQIMQQMNERADEMIAGPAEDDDDDGEDHDDEDDDEDDDGPDDDEDDDGPDDD